jgi:hypothetical protein
MSARRPIVVVVSTLCALAGGLAFASVPAFAEKIYVPGITFGSEGSGAGQLKEPGGVAVNDTNPLLEPLTGGDVYVVDRGNNRVERFNAAGEYEGQFNGSGTYFIGSEEEHGTPAPTGEFSTPSAIAVDDACALHEPELTGLECTAFDPSAGDVYVDYKGNEYGRQHSNKVIDRFGPAGEYEGEIAEATCPQPSPKQNQANQQMEREGCPPGLPVPFNKIASMAVDRSGDLWVSYYIVRPYAPGREYNTTSVAEYSDTGALIKALAGVGPSEATGMAVDADGNLYISAGKLFSYGIVEKVAGATLETAWWDRLYEDYGITALGVAVNPSTDNLLIDAGEGVALFGPFGEPYSVVNQGANIVRLSLVESLPSGGGLSDSEGLAVSVAGTAYASERGSGMVQSFDYVPAPKVTTQAASAVTETSLALNGSVNPEGEGLSACYFEYGTEVGKYTSRAECEPGYGELKGNEPIQVSAKLTGLAPLSGGASDEVRSFRLVAVSAANVTRAGKGLSVGLPVVSGETVSGVGATAALVSGEVAQGNLDTCWWIEYGAGDAYGQRLPAEGCTAIGAAVQGVKVSREVSGLQPGTSYHFRVVASNALGSGLGEGVAAATFPLGEGGLPDGRVYEMASPAGEGHREDVYVPEGMLGHIDSAFFSNFGPATEQLSRVAPDGEAVAYAGDPPVTGGNGAGGDSSGNEYVTRRSGNGVWSQVDMDASAFGQQYVAYSPGLSVGVLESFEQLTPDAPAGLMDLYARSTLAGAPLEPLLTVEPCAGMGLGFAGGNAGSTAVPGFSHLLFETGAGLSSTPAAPEGCAGANELYDEVDGRLYLVNVLPGGRVEPDANFGRQVDGDAEHEANHESDTSNVVSADGSRIFWSAVEPVLTQDTQTEERPKALYVRENDIHAEEGGGECESSGEACTVQVDAAQPGCGSCAHGGGRFWTASADGSRVFFTDERRLTQDSTAEPGSPDLYEYDLEAPEEERLVDLSVGAGRGGYADVLGGVGVSEDGAYVYFVAAGVLSAKNLEEKEPVQGQPNLYVRHGGVTSFIVTLSPGDDHFEDGATIEYSGDWQPAPDHRTAQVTPDGHSVVFMSRLALTAYDNVLGVDEAPLTEVFVYDTDSGRLLCASCNPSGEAPVAPTPAQYYSQSGDLNPLVWGSFLPTSESFEGRANYQPQVISDDGSQVFFDSIEPLVPRDSNGYLDVYEWERDGSGSCEQPQGCIYLLSDGVNPENSYLVGAGATGGDVFFVSRADLVKADRGGETEELYDARVDGVSAPEEASCSGTGCQGVPPAPPIFATPASVTFNGVGDFTPAAVQPGNSKSKPTCANGHRLSHGKCLKTMGKHTGKTRKARKAKKAKKRGRR